MSLRQVTRRAAAAAAATAAAGTLAAMAFTAPAGASPASGDIVPNAAAPQGTVTPGTPFDSGQTISVNVPANSAFAGSHTGLAIEECAAPNGVVPTNVAACDGLTHQGDTVLPNADGSFSYNAFTVYALPDAVSLGESPGGPVCGSTSATECILYIGDNQNDFTQPHLWSQPFFVKANGNDTGANPGDGTPEVPLAIILPVAAMGLLGGTVLIRRRRAARNA